MSATSPVSAGPIGSPAVAPTVPEKWIYPNGKDYDTIDLFDYLANPQHKKAGKVMQDQWRQDLARRGKKTAGQHARHVAFLFVTWGANDVFLTVGFLIFFYHEFMWRSIKWVARRPRVWMDPLIGSKESTEKKLENLARAISAREEGLAPGAPGGGPTGPVGPGGPITGPPGPGGPAGGPAGGPGGPGAPGIPPPVAPAGPVGPAGGPTPGGPGGTTGGPTPTGPASPTPGGPTPGAPSPGAPGGPTPTAPPPGPAPSGPATSGPPASPAPSASATTSVGRAAEGDHADDFALWDAELGDAELGDVELASGAEAAAEAAGESEERFRDELRKLGRAAMPRLVTIADEIERADAQLMGRESDAATDRNGTRDADRHEQDLVDRLLALADVHEVERVERIVERTVDAMIENVSREEPAQVNEPVHKARSHVAPKDYPQWMFEAVPPEVLVEAQLATIDLGPIVDTRDELLLGALDTLARLDVEVAPARPASQFSKPFVLVDSPVSRVAPVNPPSVASPPPSSPASHPAKSRANSATLPARHPDGASGVHESPAKLLAAVDPPSIPVAIALEIAQVPAIIPIESLPVQVAAKRAASQAMSQLDEKRRREVEAAKSLGAYRPQQGLLSPTSVTPSAGLQAQVQSSTAHVRRRPDEQSVDEVVNHETTGQERELPRQVSQQQRREEVALHGGDVGQGNSEVDHQQNPGNAGDLGRNTDGKKGAAKKKGRRSGPRTIAG